MAQHTGTEATAEHLHTSGADLGHLQAALQRWFAGRLDDPRLSGLSLPSGNGVSSDTVLFEVTWREGGGRRSQRCAARLEPDRRTHRVFPHYDLPAQARLLRLVAQRSAVPVPAVLWDEPDPGPLGTPFFVMEQVQGLVPPDVMPYPFGSWVTEASVDQRRRLQDSAVAVLAQLHTMPVTLDELRFLTADAVDAGDPGSSLRRHVDASRRYYEWVVAQGGARSPLLDAAYDWVQRHCPAAAPPAVLSWGDARIGNIVFRDFEAVGVLDWEMAGVGPGGIDVGWMVFLHRFLDDLAVDAGLPGLPDLLRLDEVAAAYDAAGGHSLDDLEFYATYAAARMGAIILREQQRPLLGSGQRLPDDVDSLVLHRRALQQMLAGTYWAQH